MHSHPKARRDGVFCTRCGQRAASGPDMPTECCADYENKKQPHSLHPLQKSPTGREFIFDLNGDVMPLVYFVHTVGDEMGQMRFDEVNGETRAIEAELCT
jgi:hypothetical protein